MVGLVVVGGVILRTDQGCSVAETLLHCGMEEEIFRVVVHWRTFLTDVSLWVGSLGTVSLMGITLCYFSTLYVTRKYKNSGLLCEYREGAVGIHIFSRMGNARRTNISISVYVPYEHVLFWGITLFYGKADQQFILSKNRTSLIS